MRMVFTNNEYETKPILHFLWRNNSYWIYHKNTLDEGKQEEDPADRLWHIVKYCKNKECEEPGVKLKQGDVIKLGRIRFKIKEINKGIYQLKDKEEVVEQDIREQKQISKPQINNYIKQSEMIRQGRSSGRSKSKVHVIGSRIIQALNSKNSLENTDTEQIEGLKMFKQEESAEGSQKSIEQIIWRIWLSEVNEDEESTNPIISPWKCNGTMKYIHTECLKAWLNSKGIINRRNGGDETISYVWKSLDWELCKTKFSDNFTVNNKQISLINIEKPEGPYIILENMMNNSSRAIYVLGMLNRDTVKIGRGHDSEVRVADISVSRLHALIK